MQLLLCQQGRRRVDLLRQTHGLPRLHPPPLRRQNGGRPAGQVPELPGGRRARGAHLVVVDGVREGPCTYYYISIQKSCCCFNKNESNERNHISALIPMELQIISHRHGSRNRNIYRCILCIASNDIIFLFILRLQLESKSCILARFLRGLAARAGQDALFSCLQSSYDVGSNDDTVSYVNQADCELLAINSLVL